VRFLKCLRERENAKEYEREKKRECLCVKERERERERTGQECIEKGVTVKVRKKVRPTQQREGKMF
jgi:hypothetical protein